jgi:hypothetical protein
MTDYEALQIIIKITELRMNAQYQAAEALRRRVGASTLARSAPESDEHAAGRLLIGTWDRIAMFVQDFNDQQRRRFFAWNPVLLVWKSLQPAVEIIRTSGAVSRNFASAFEGLASQYQEWTQTPDGQQFRTEAQQAVGALFA